MIDEDLFEILSVFLKRREIVCHLFDEPSTKRTLASSLDHSRSTVDRAIRELENHALVTYERDRYELTPLGEQVTIGTTELLAGSEVARELGSVLQYLPLETFDLDLRLLEDADVYRPEPGNPWAMVNHHVGVLKQSDSIRAVLPLTGLAAHETVHERVVDHDAQAEVVGCPEVIRTFITDDDFTEKTEAMESTGRYRLFQLNDSPPYFLGLMDEVVQIGVDEEGEPRAIIESTDPRVRDWAETVYERFRKRAQPVELSTTASASEDPTVDRN